MLYGLHLKLSRLLQFSVLGWLPGLRRDRHEYLPTFRRTALHGPPIPFPTPPVGLRTDLANAPILNDPHDGDYSFCRNVGISCCST